MKKIILCACLVAMLHPAFGQLYVRASVGYNLPVGSELMGTSETYEQVPDVGYVETFEGVYGSYGTGFSASVALGGTFGNGLLGYDAAFGYLLGKEYSVSSVSNYQGYTYSS